MQCFICDQQAAEEPIQRGGKLVNCSGCGWYKISGTAIALMRQNIYVFNVPSSLEWLRMQRENGTEQPFIDSENTLWG
jgi:hypothetical protein